MGVGGDGFAFAGSPRPEMLKRGGQSTATAIDAILDVLAALLLTASAVVLLIARVPTASARSR